MSTPSIAPRRRSRSTASRSSPAARIRSPSYEIDSTTGEPTLIQHIDTRGIHCRTFHIDPSGRLLVAAHIMALPVRDGARDPYRAGEPGGVPDRRRRQARFRPQIRCGCRRPDDVLDGHGTACSLSVARAGSPFEVLRVFLRLGLTSFGGPVAHLGYFRAEFVERRRWLDEAAYADIVALCQFLPGPASSQTGISIGILRAGLLGGFFAWLGFTAPSAVAMILFGYGVTAFGNLADSAWLHGLKIVAVAVVAQAVWGMARNLCPDRERATIAVGAANGGARDAIRSWSNRRDRRRRADRLGTVARRATTSGSTLAVGSSAARLVGAWRSSAFSRC